MERARVATNVAAATAAATGQSIRPIRAPAPKPVYRAVCSRGGACEPTTRAALVSSALPTGGRGTCTLGNFAEGRPGRGTCTLGTCTSGIRNSAVTNGSVTVAVLGFFATGRAAALFAVLDLVLGLVGVDLRGCDRFLVLVLVLAGFSGSVSLSVVMATPFDANARGH